MEKATPFISIIVPVFNVADYLKQCIESITNQDFKDLEIILINDGSTDSSPEICDLFARQDGRISVIHQKNTGLSGARNSGIRAATGSYILFIDADDFIGNVLNDIVKKLRHQKNIDVMFLEAFKYFNGKVASLGDNYNQGDIENQSKIHVLNHLSTLPKFPGSACSKITSRELILKHNLYFLPGVFSEDLYWTAELLLKAEIFAYCESPYYFYRQNRSHSITKTFSSYKFSCVLDFVDKYSDRTSNEIPDEYRLYMQRFASYEYIIAISMFANLDKESQLKYLAKMESLSWLLNFRSDKKAKFAKMLYKAFGLKITSLVLNKILQLRKIIQSSNL